MSSSQASMKRITISLPDEIAKQLEQWAGKQGRPTAHLVSYLVESGLREAIDKGEFTPEKSADPGQSGK